MTSDATPHWIFRRALGIVYLFAFWSLARQIIGLLGHDGILPAQDYMNEIRTWAATNQVGLDRFRLFPTLAWISVSDTFLFSLCIAGVVASMLLAVGFVPLVTAPLLWLLYLSLSVVGQDFLRYQWDALLLETGFLAIFVAPAVWRDRLRDAQSPPRLGKWLLLWLLFRLSVGSGAIKLASGDPTWRNLTALTYHYQTQPIPTAIAWYAHRLPLWFQKTSTLGVFAIELGVPFFMFGPRRLRIVACALMVGLQALIALTGNYAFFNLLSAALCLPLLDDRVCARLLRFRTPLSALPAPPALPALAAPPVRTASRVRRSLLVAVAVLTLPVSALNFGRSFGIQLSGLRLAAPLAELTFPFHSVNTYGLFAVMTTRRPEIIVQGSDDQIEWKTYGFRYKPGDLNRRPPFVAPHQPRLDWQMWFAALSNFDSEPWFQSFCLKLLQGSPDVLSLLEQNPFPDRPPRYVRGELYRYEFATDTWWAGERLGSYSPALSLSNARPSR